jgi:hypothetical protein
MCIEYFNSCLDYFNTKNKNISVDNHKELLPHIKLVCLKEKEEYNMIEDGIFVKHKYLMEYTEIYDSFEKFLEFKDKDSVIRLSLRNMNISDITFLTQFPNLISLDLSFNNIKELSGFSKLEKLKKLNLSYNTFTSVKGLEKNQNLEELFMACNPIDSVDELKSLSSLRVLDIEETMVSSIEVLDELKHLEYVYVPFICRLGLISNKLKNIMTFSKLIGKGLTSSTVYFNNIYLLSDGLYFGRKKFTL